MALNARAAETGNIGEEFTGCHRLIGERCAEIVTSVSDALELLLPLSSQSTGTLSGDDA
jgi:predicted Rossmann fold nucleotide-binding protein DprA/Smf involved in DNA uptake